VRIIHVKSAGILSEEYRERLESIVYPDTQSAVATLQALFPSHAVVANEGLVRVTNRDHSINVAVFKEEARFQSPGTSQTGFHPGGDHQQK
jgi:hypothetical protein